MTRPPLRARCRGGACVAGCGGSDDTPTEVVLVTHDSFAISDDVKQAFESESGLKLRILKAGDAGEIVTRALLTAGNPEGDVLFGVDNNLLQRTLDGDVFEAYESPELANVDPALWLDPDHRATPIDRGDVCLNYDKAWFAERGLEPPHELEDLILARYRNLLVVENPATSTPGLAFMLATIAKFGDRWQSYWEGLRRERRPRRRRLGGRLLLAVLRLGGEQGQAADRRLVRVEPARGGHLREASAEDGADRSRGGELLPAGRVRRGSARREERGRCAGADRLHALEALPGGHPAADVRVPRAQRCRVAAGVREVRRRARAARSSSRPRRSSRTGSAGWTSGRTS